MSSYTGNVDQPLDPENNDNDKDLLKVGPYIEGLSDFIRTCATPMTIAIQGDWGTGKTSMMNMIRSKVAPMDSGPNGYSGVHTLWFNTWQYSQFNMSENLPISLLSYLVEKISADEINTNQESIRMLKKGLGIIAKMGMKAISSYTGIPVDAILSVEEVKINFPVALENLKSNFETAVADLLESKKKTRLVVFIDDLDRLNPEIAVEVLEVLKIFLDVKNCVYVLAVDYEVVTQGIVKKFGENVGGLKGKSFFDKMIQLPFKMPVQLFKLNDFLESQLSSYNIKNQKVIFIFEELIKNSIGSNPRTMKRLFNSFHLIRNIMNRDEEIDAGELDEYDSQLLFAVLCLQMAFDPLYEYFIETNEWSDSTSENNIFSQDIEGVKKRISLYSKVSDDKYEKRIFKYVKILSKVISLRTTVQQDLGIPDEADLEHFKQILSYSSVTTTSNTSETSSTEISLSNDLNLSLYTITRVQYKDAKFDVKGFTAAFVWILEQIGKNEKHNRRFHDVALRPKEFDIPEMFFNGEKIEKEKKYKPSVIKEIKSLNNYKVFTSYATKELKGILLKLLFALDISLDNIKFIGSEK